MKRLFLMLILLVGCNQSEIKTYEVEVLSNNEVEKFTIKSRGSPTSYRSDTNDLIIYGFGTGETRTFLGPKIKSVSEEKVLAEISK